MGFRCLARVVMRAHLKRLGTGSHSGRVTVAKSNRIVGFSPFAASSLSGGVQSSLTALMAREGVSYSLPDCAICAETH